MGILFYGAMNLPGSVLASEQDPRTADLQAHLESLAAEHGFQITGLNMIAETNVEIPSGDLLVRLSQLLSEFNYILSNDSRGKPQLLKILGKKKSESIHTARQYRVKTTRKGSAHYVDAVIMGKRPERTRFKMLVDTGASMLVLPRSLMEPLGYREDELEQIQIQTTNGKVTGEVGLLNQVEVGRAVRNNVRFSFVEDEKLGDTVILGMAFLSGYAVTIDDAQNLLLLKETIKAKENTAGSE
ncbi:MAG: hypothetical protein GY703_14065 [Gammaproteobacteria bacterium]|nr:hypothetical protein [Gammaproteobacteria bacterium]